MTGNKAIDDWHSKSYPSGEDFDFLDLQSSDYMAGEFSPLLYCFARGRRAKIIVELGVWKGLTGIWLAKAAKLNHGHYYGVDIGAYKTEAIQRFESLGLDDFATYIEGNSWQVGLLWDKGPIDILFIDACHDKPDVQNDIAAWLPHVKPLGYVFFHDWNGKTGVQSALHEFLASKDGKAWVMIPLLWEENVAVLFRSEGMKFVPQIR